MIKAKPKRIRKVVRKTPCAVDEINLRLSSLNAIVHQLYDLREQQKGQMQKIVNCMDMIAQPRILPAAVNEIVRAAMIVAKLPLCTGVGFSKDELAFARLRKALAAVPTLKTA